MTDYEKVESIISLMTSHEIIDYSDYYEAKPNSNWYIAIQLLKGDNLLKHQVIRKLSFLTIKDCINNTNICIPHILQSKYNGEWKTIGGNVLFVNHRCGSTTIQIYKVFWKNNSISPKTKVFDLTNPEECVDLMHRLDSFFDSLLYNILNE